MLGVAPEGDVTSDIEWLLGHDRSKGFSWNPLTGCGPESAGCLNCYAAQLAGRGMCEDHVGLTRSVKRRNDKGRLVKLAVFNNTIHMHPERLEDPLRKRKGKRVFVNSMSDLFHPDVPFEFIDSIFGVMAAAQQHTFLVLTKRAYIAPRFFEWMLAHKSRHGSTSADCIDRVRQRYPQLAERIPEPGLFRIPWPLPNVQLGFSAEDQPNWDRRYSEFKAVPTHVRWVSVEPQLGPVELELDRMDWVVVGGESGPGARPFDVDWASSIVEQCVRAEVPVFVKQLGSRPIRNGRQVVLGDKKGKDIHEWTGSLAHLGRREILYGPEPIVYRFA